MTSLQVPHGLLQTVSSIHNIRTEYYVYTHAHTCHHPPPPSLPPLPLSSLFIFTPLSHPSWFLAPPPPDSCYSSSPPLQYSPVVWYLAGCSGAQVPIIPTGGAPQSSPCTTLHCADPGRVLYTYCSSPRSLLGGRVPSPLFPGGSSTSCLWFSYGLLSVTYARVSFCLGKYKCLAPSSFNMGTLVPEKPQHHH